MKVVLLGWNGALNVGDDAMTLAMLLELNKNKKVKEVELFSRSKEANFSFLNGINFNFKIKVNRFVYTIQNRLLKSVYLRFIFPLKLVLSYNYIIIGGGTIFHSSGDNFIYHIVTSLSKFLKKIKTSKVIICGTSIGPFNTKKAENLFVKVYKKIDKIVVRDNRSFMYCQKLEVPCDKLILSEDLALSLIEYEEFQLKENNFSIEDYCVIVLRRNKVSEEQYEWINSFLDYLNKNTNLNIVFATFCDVDDYSESDKIEVEEFVKKLSDEVRNKSKIHYYQENLKEMYGLLNKAKFVISSRLHGGIISHSLSKKMVMLSYHTKCSDFYEDMKLNKIGLIDSESVKNKDFESLYQFLLENKDSTKNKKLIWLNKAL